MCPEWLRAVAYCIWQYALTGDEIWLHGYLAMREVAE